MTHRDIREDDEVTTIEWDPADVQKLYAKVGKVSGGDGRLPLNRVAIGVDALDGLEDAVLELSKGLGGGPGSGPVPVLIIQDATDIRRGGDSVKCQVRSRLVARGHSVEVAELAPDRDGLVHTTLDVVGDVERRLVRSTVVVALGSGTVTDIAKQAVHPMPLS